MCLLFSIAALVCLLVYRLTVCLLFSIAALVCLLAYMTHSAYCVLVAVLQCRILSEGLIPQELVSMVSRHLVSWSLFHDLH